MDQFKGLVVSMLMTTRRRLAVVFNPLDVVWHFFYYRIGNIRASWKGVRLGPGARVSPYAEIDGVAFIGRATIGRQVSLGQGSYINSGEITAGKIGRWCSLGYDVLIGPTEHDLLTISTSPNFPDNRRLEEGPNREHLPPPVIEDDVWIGARAIVLRGVRIGSGAVVAAGAVVVNDVKPCIIVGGVPARPLAERFASPETSDYSRGLLNQIGKN